jgi:hypothetical protein
MPEPQTPPQTTSTPTADLSTADDAIASDASGTADAPDTPSRVVQPARHAIEAIRTSVAAAAEPLMDRVGQAIDGAGRTWNERPGARIRRVRRMGRSPLPYINDVHPEARLARPVQVGLRTIDVDEMAGTAVGGGDQRGGDFLPLKPFRGQNWQARWQRLKQAHDNLAMLPPIDVVKYADRYWVEDGHNRVGLALYGGQRAIDANIVELVPPGGRRTEPILSLASSAADSRSVRTAGSGHRPSYALSHEDSIAPVPADGDEDGEADGGEAHRETDGETDRRADLDGAG